jgi:hypothetical protein
MSAYVGFCFADLPPGGVNSLGEALGRTPQHVGWVAYSANGNLSSIEGPAPDTVVTAPLPANLTLPQLEWKGRQGRLRVRIKFETPQLYHFAFLRLTDDGEWGVMYEGDRAMRAEDVFGSFYFAVTLFDVRPLGVGGVVSGWATRSLTVVHLVLYVWSGEQFCRADELQRSSWSGGSPAAVWPRGAATWIWCWSSGMGGGAAGHDGWFLSHAPTHAGRARLFQVRRH